jgi:hypothetical protein
MNSPRKTFKVAENLEGLHANSNTWSRYADHRAQST